MNRCALPEGAQAHMGSRSLTAKLPNTANDAYAPQ